MSKIGKQPVQIPEGVQVNITNNTVQVSGPKGTVSKSFPADISVTKEGEQVIVKSLHNSKQSLANWGSIRSHIYNMVTGVTNSWTKSLEIEGAGYRAEVNGKDLKLTIGYSHPVIIKAPESIAFQVEKNIVKVEGPDKELVGWVSSQVREARPPDPYTGKGIKFTDEIVRRKPGKAAGKTTE